MIYNTLKSCYHEFERINHCSTGFVFFGFFFIHIFTFVIKYFHFIVFHFIVLDFIDTDIFIFNSHILAWYFGQTHNMLNGNEFLLGQIPGGGEEITG